MILFLNTNYCGVIWNKRNKAILYFAGQAVQHVDKFVASCQFGSGANDYNITNEIQSNKVWTYFMGLTIIP